jgi:hypothetical protein
MSCVSFNPSFSTQNPSIYGSSSVTVLLPVSPIATQASNSVSRSNSTRPGLLLGADLLSDDSLFRTFFQQVKALERDDEEDAPPDSRALAEVLRLIPFSRLQLAQKWSVPRISSDGFGGIRLTWQKGNQEVRAVISGNQTTRSSYLYWENGDIYETVPNFTAATLSTYLERLEKAARVER